ncbi:hypothetical protein IAQ61_002066 [Plenodomus lingam]|uniref:uncharacterized protein n=1 Tax=Leptosphaeria maculans TaxID=5022 RepID=UPI00332CCBFE|nr:hypothetical protein IAQ61_002066 [Plenodomus lingam]
MPKLILIPDARTIQLSISAHIFILTIAIVIPMPTHSASSFPPVGPTDIPSRDLRNIMARQVAICESMDD